MKAGDRAVIWEVEKDQHETQKAPDGPIVWKWIEVGFAVLVARATGITLPGRGDLAFGYRNGPWESWLVRFENEERTRLRYVRERDLITEG